MTNSSLHGEVQTQRVSLSFISPPDAGDENLIYSFFPAALKLRLLDVPSSSEWRDMIEAEPSLLTKSTPLSEWGLYDHPNETFWGS